MNTKKHYIDQFAARIGSKRITAVDKTYYKQRFHWRLEFNFSQKRRYSEEWNDFLYALRERGFTFRTRIETSQNVYTSDYELLDFVLSGGLLYQYLHWVNYVNDVYLEELSEAICGDAITDIKFVKTVPEYCYCLHLGGFDWLDPLKKTLSEYLYNNKDEFEFKGFYKNLINRWGGSSFVYDGFNFYAKNTDDILMLHIIAPGKIKKIVKLMERKKKHEDLIG